MYEIADKTKLNINAHKNVSTLKELTKVSTKSIIAALITKVKIPKVIRLMGKVIASNIGLITALTTPSSNATQREAIKPSI
jgi:hypothetical protein